jgi:septal ring factor EnvC (AmiA/AmiB activator)
MARPVRNNEVAGKLRTLKDQLAEYKEELKTVHPTFKISKNGKRLSNINATIQKLEREIEELKKRGEK